jgi:hypothetical protein
MNDRVNPVIGRRDMLRGLAMGSGAAAVSAATIAPAAADSESNSEKRKARYQANSPEVQTFYRVNRYPTT